MLSKVLAMSLLLSNAADLLVLWKKTLMMVSVERNVALDSNHSTLLYTRAVP